MSNEFIRQAQRFTLYIFFFSISFEMFVPIEAIGMSLSKYTAIFYFLTLIPELNSFVRINQVGIILSLAGGFFMLLTIVSIININEISGQYFDITIFQNIILFWFLINHARKDYLILEKGMLFFAFGTVLMAFFYFIGIGVEYTADRLTIFKENENILGLNMIIGIVVLLLSILQNKLKIGNIRYLFLLPIPLMLNVMFATGSRLAFLSLILCFVAGILLLKTRQITGKIVVVVIGTIGLLVLGVLLLQHDVMKDRLLTSVQEGDFANREDIWRNLIPLIKEKPVFGAGNTGYLYYTHITFGRETSPHNVILEVLCLTGIVGFLIYFSFLFNIILKGFSSYRRTGLLLPLLLASPLMGSIFSGQILTRKIGWLILAYIVGSTALKRKSNNSDSIQPIENEDSLRN